MLHKLQPVEYYVSLLSAVVAVSLPMIHDLKNVVKYWCHVVNIIVAASRQKKYGSRKLSLDVLLQVAVISVQAWMCWTNGNLLWVGWQGINFSGIHSRYKFFISKKCVWNCNLTLVHICLYRTWFLYKKFSFSLKVPETTIFGQASICNSLLDTHDAVYSCCWWGSFGPCKMWQKFWITVKCHYNACHYNANASLTRSILGSQTAPPCPHDHPRVAQHMG